MWIDLNLNPLNPQTKQTVPPEISTNHDLQNGLEVFSNAQQIESNMRKVSPTKKQLCPGKYYFRIVLWRTDQIFN